MKTPEELAQNYYEKLDPVSRSSEEYEYQAYLDGYLDARKSYKDELLEAFQYLASYFWNELGWENFRAEMVGGTKEYVNARMYNAANIARVLAECEEKWPELKNIIQDAKTE